MTPEGRPESVDELNAALSRALICSLQQASHGHAVLWNALVSTLMAKGLVDHADLAVAISESAGDLPQEIKAAPIFQSIVFPAMKSLVLCEYPTLEAAPEWVQAMCRGEGVARKANPGEPGSFVGAEGPPR